MKRAEAERLLEARNRMVAGFSDEDSLAFFEGLAELDELLGIDATAIRDWLRTMDNVKSVTIDQLDLRETEFRVVEQEGGAG